MMKHSTPTQQLEGSATPRSAPAVSAALVNLSDAGLVFTEVPRCPLPTCAWCGETGLDIAA